MAKKINVKPIEVIALEFEDGVQKNCKFSAKAMMILDDEFEGFKKTFSDAKEKPFSAGAKLLYAGLKVCDEDITFDAAQKIAVNLSVENILELFILASESFGDFDNKALKKTISET